MGNIESLRLGVMVHQSEKRLRQSLNPMKKRKSNENSNVYVAKDLVESDLQSTLSISDSS